MLLDIDENKLDPDSSVLSNPSTFNSETLLKNDVEQEAHKETFREMLLLLRDRAFMLFAVSNFLTSLGYPIPYTFVLDNALKLGLTDVLLNTYDWKTCLVILGGICFVNCIFGLMFKPLPKYQEEDSIGCEQMGDTNSETLLKNDVEQETHKETFREMLLLLRDWAFMLFAVSNFLTSLGYLIPYTFIPDNALKLGLTETQGSYLVGLIGISNTIARVVLGALSQKLNRLFLYNTCLVICGLTMAISNFLQPIAAAILSSDCTQAVSNTSLIPTLNSSVMIVIEPV